MKRNYKPRDFFSISCRECSEPVKTNSYRTLMCKQCSSYNEYKKNMLDYKWRLNRLIASAKNRAKEKSLKFNLTKEYIISLWEESNGICSITNQSFDLNYFGKKGQVNPNAPSIDRIIPELGYVEGNVRLVTYHVNVALSEFGLEKLIELSMHILKGNR